MNIKQGLGKLRHVAMAGILVVAAMDSGLGLTPMQDLQPLHASHEDPGGLVYNCPRSDMSALADALKAYIGELGVTTGMYRINLSQENGTLQLVLNDKLHGTDTLNLIHRLEFDLKEELVQLPALGKKPRTVVTVSQKEILLALLQNGRTTRFNGAGCSVDALRDQVGIRQNVVAWAESLEWSWPNGGSARWNGRYWNRGDLKPHKALHLAIADVFLRPQKYAVGCYTATKLVMIQGILDYYRRVKNDIATAEAIEKRLMQDGDPLTHIEPGAAWYFEKESTPDDMARAGKLLFLTHGIPADNFVPGDWSYFLNTDPVTYEKTGYEGSNSIYLGRGKFDDYYNDNNHSYTYQEKLLEVYQWRHKVFSRERDVAKIHPLSSTEIEKLGQTPEHGGLEIDYRMTPYDFRFAELPAILPSFTRP